MDHHGTKNLINWWIIFCIIHSSLFWVYYQKKKKNHEKLGDNRPIKTCVNKTENTITFKTKEKNCLQILTPETMKILGSSKIKIDKNKIGESIPHLEIAEVVLVYWNVVSNDYQTDSRFL